MLVINLDVGIFFSMKDQIVNVLDFVGQAISVVTTQLCFCMKAAIGSTQTYGHGCVPGTLFSWTLIFEFHVTSTCYEIVFSFDLFFNYL